MFSFHIFCFIYWITRILTHTLVIGRDHFLKIPRCDQQCIDPKLLHLSFDAACMKFPCVTDTYTVPVNFCIQKVRKLRPGVTGASGLLEKSGEEEKSEQIKGRIICLKTLPI